MIHTAVIAFGVGAVLGGVVVGVMAAAGAKRRIADQIERARRAEREARDVERLAELGSMTAGLAHEIKNPLSTIGLNAQLLRECVDDLPRDRPADDADRATLARRVDGLSREAERLGGILSDFLEYAGELHLEPTPADLNTLAEELGDFFLPQAEQSGVRLRVERSPIPASVRIDEPHLKQGVLNLLLNATQAMSGPNHPASRRKELILRVVVREGEGSLHVIDTGPGIPEQARERVFEPYFTTRSGGTGLGLPTTRRIVAALGGRLELHTDPDKGTDFAITFPLAGD